MDGSNTGCSVGADRGLEENGHRLRRFGDPAGISQESRHSQPGQGGGNESMMVSPVREKRRWKELTAWTRLEYVFFGQIPWRRSNSLLD